MTGSTEPRPAHHTRAEYAALAELLTDVALCAGDVRHLADTALLVLPNDLEFLARRLQRLARSALNALPAEERGHAG